MASHDLNDGDRFLLIDRGVQRNFTDGCSDIAGSAAVSGSMVCNRKIIIDGFRNTDKRDFLIIMSCPAGKLISSVHGVISANIENSANI